MQTSTTPQLKQYQLHLAWTLPVLFNTAIAWLGENFKEEDAHWDYISGRSWIDSKVYPAAVCFKNEEDYLVFRLKFKELLKF
jgi:hypothetical protein